MIDGTIPTSAWMWEHPILFFCSLVVVGFLIYLIPEPPVNKKRKKRKENKMSEDNTKKWPDKMYPDTLHNEVYYIRADLAKEREAKLIEKAWSYGEGNGFWSPSEGYSAKKDMGIVYEGAGLEELG